MNYVSGVVLKRNSMLNLAVIDRRHNITKWLIEEKGAGIESCDRGQFTPLMSDAWNGITLYHPQYNSLLNNVTMLSMNICYVR